MASGDAWQAGWNLGAGYAQDKYAHKQALSDAELQQKIGDQINLRGAFSEKLRNAKPGTPEYDEAHRGLFNTMTALRDLYHPQSNPNAISRFGHMLTDHLKITDPQQRAGEQQRKNVQGLAGDEQATGQFAAALPPSDIEAAHRDVQAKMGALREQVEQATKIWDENNKDAAPEQRDRAHKEISDSLLWGYKPNATSERGYWETKKGTKPDPKDPIKRVPFTYSHNRYTDENEDADHNPLGAADLEGFVEDPKAAAKPRYGWSKDKSGRIFSVQLDANNQMVSGSENYNMLPPAGMLPTIRTGVYHWVDENNAVHETPETTTSRKDYTGTAGGGAPRTGTSNPPNGGQVTPTPHQSNLQSPTMMKQKIAHNLQRSLQSRDKILGYKGNSVLTKAESAQTDADAISRTADELAQSAETNPNNMSEADTNFVLKLIRSEAGRVNQQEIAMLFNAGGVAEGPERWLAKIGHGQLSVDLRNQLIDFAHSMKDVANQEVQRLKQHPDDPNNPTPAPTGSDWRSRAIPIK